MWLISNIAANSIPDLNAVIKQSNLIKTVTMVCSDSIRSTKQEAVSTICDIIVKLVNEHELRMLSDVFKEHQLNTVLLEVLKNDLHSPMN